GSFGTQKEHYGLRKIAARIKSTEIMLIFFGIHTANVVNLARRESIQLPLTAKCPTHGIQLYGSGGFRRDGKRKYRP
ncbi:MAG: hypothetical protein PUC79_07875, partial [Prevotellaceae bacterium]|nr:hypothetical protein [Prevotellaceae bacterium]